MDQTTAALQEAGVVVICLSLTTTIRLTCFFLLLTPTAKIQLVRAVKSEKSSEQSSEK
jgi:hypothetical protein